MPTAKSCKKCNVAGDNVREIRAEIRYHIPANLPTCFYKYACIVLCTQLVLILRGTNILSSTILKYNMIIYLLNIMVHYPLCYLWEWLETSLVIQTKREYQTKRNWEKRNLRTLLQSVSSYFPQNHRSLSSLTLIWLPKEERNPVLSRLCCVLHSQPQYGAGSPYSQVFYSSCLPFFVSIFCDHLLQSVSSFHCTLLITGSVYCSCFLLLTDQARSSWYCLCCSYGSQHRNGRIINGLQRAKKP